MQLFGQTPETALLSALAAIEFYNNQVQVSVVAHQMRRQPDVKRIPATCMQDLDINSKDRHRLRMRSLHAAVSPTLTCTAQVVSDQQQRELNGRVKKVQEQCRLKLQEVHNGYLQGARASHAGHCKPGTYDHRAVQGHACAILRQWCMLLYCLTTFQVRAAAKKKYKELLGIKADLEADNKELVEKYAQKAQ